MAKTLVLTGLAVVLLAPQTAADVAVKSRCEWQPMKVTTGLRRPAISAAAFATPSAGWVVGTDWYGGRNDGFISRWDGHR